MINSLISCSWVPWIAQGGQSVDIKKNKNKKYVPAVQITEDINQVKLQKIAKKFPADNEWKVIAKMIKPTRLLSHIISSYVCVETWLNL